MNSTNSTGVESASPFASPSDALAISSFGQYLEFVVKSVVPEAIFFGAYTILVVIAVYTLLARPSRQAQTLWLAAALVITYSCEIVNISFNIASLLKFIRETLISSNNINLPLGDRVDTHLSWFYRAQVDNIQTAIGIAGDGGLMFLITDALTIWRAMAVCRMSSRRALGSTMYLLLFVSLVFWLTFMVLLNMDDEFRYGGRAIDNSDPMAIISTTSSVASIATSILATAVIGQAAWQYRLLQVQAGFRSEGARVLLFLTESGLFYVIIQIIRLALTLSVVPSTPTYGSLVSAGTVFHNITRIMTAMYTPALIIIIQYGYSIADTIQAGRTSGGGDHHSMGRGRRADGRTLSALAFRRRTQGTNGTGSDVTGHLSSGDMMGTSGSSVNEVAPVAEKTIARQNGVTVEA